MTEIRGFAPGLFASQRDAAQLKGMRDGLADLNRQLATGRRAQTLGAYASGRSTALDMRAVGERADAFRETALRGRQRLALMTGALERMGEINRAARSDAAQVASITTAGGVTSAALAAKGRLGEALGLLNSDFDGQHLFAGRASDKEPMVSLTALLDGEAGAAGLKTLIAERRQADLGDGRGRLATSVAGAAVTVAEEAAGLPFGFKLAGARSGLSGATATGPAGSPAAIGLTFAGQPADGETIAFDLDLPDGSRETLTLVARTNPAAGAQENAFAIGGSPATTAANVKAALDEALGDLGSRALAASSAIVAAKDMMDASATSPARRIAGPPFATATGHAAAGSRATVTWYRGDDDATADPRASQIAGVDRGLSLAVGARADEPALASGIAGLAALAAESAAAGDAAAPARFQALAQRASGLFGGAGGQEIRDISTDLSLASASMEAAAGRQAQRRAFVDGVLGDIEVPSIEELSASILSLQTRLQASYQATASLSRLSLADYLR